MTATADWRAWTCHVRLAVTDGGALDEARGLLTAWLADVDRAASRFRPDSGLTAVVRAGGDWVDTGPLLTELLAVALRAARRTDGAVDPTVGGSLAGLGYDRTSGRRGRRGIALLDDAEAPLLPVPAPGWSAVELDRAGCRVRVAPGVRLDLGATAKAWTADAAAADIAGRTGVGCLVSIGGDLAVAGPAPAGGWRVRVEDVTGRPGDAPSGSWAVVTITDGGLATSSTAARRWRRAGVPVHHLVDPRTGMPAPPDWRTVSVAAASCVDANTVSTAAVVRGRDALPWLRAIGLPARLVSGEGRVLTLGGWPAEEAA